MRAAADQTVSLAKLTPHRVMRELYEQTIAYWRAYADTLPQYVPADDNLALVANSTSGALVWICSAIRYGSAPARAPLVARAAPPSDIAPIGDPADPQRFLTTLSPVCGDWASNVSKYNADTAAWKNGIDPNLPASQWPAEQRALFTSVSTVLLTNATAVQQLRHPQRESGIRRLRGSRRTVSARLCTGDSYVCSGGQLLAQRRFAIGCCKQSGLFGGGIAAWDWASPRAESVEEIVWAIRLAGHRRTTAPLNRCREACCSSGIGCVGSSGSGDQHQGEMFSAGVWAGSGADAGNAAVESRITEMTSLQTHLEKWIAWYRVLVGIIEQAKMTITNNIADAQRTIRDIRVHPDLDESEREALIGGLCDRPERAEYQRSRRSDGAGASVQCMATTAKLNSSTTERPGSARIARI